MSLHRLLRNRYFTIFLGLLTSLSILVAFQAPSIALIVDESSRTVSLNEVGEPFILSNDQLTNGQRLFIQNCTKCHIQGQTKTNPEVNLSLEALAGALPPRDNLENLVDYIQSPTSYDGEVDLDLFHPNTTRIDIFPELSNLSSQDEIDLAGYMLIAPKLDSRWGQ